MTSIWESPEILDMALLYSSRFAALLYQLQQFIRQRRITILKHLVLRSCGFSLSNPQVQTRKFQPLNSKSWIAFQNGLQQLDRLRGLSKSSLRAPKVIISKRVPLFPGISDIRDGGFEGQLRPVPTPQLHIDKPRVVIRPEIFAESDRLV